MYSKITHNIVEEHFDSIPVAQSRKISGIYDNVQLENTPKAIEFRQNSRDLFTQYDAAFRDYLVSSLSKVGDPMLSKSRIEMDLPATLLRMISAGYYTTDRMTPMVDAWKTVTSDIIAVIDAIAAKQDRTPMVDKTRSDIDFLAQTMVKNALPSTGGTWTVEGTSNLLNSYLDDVIEQTMARSEQSWTKDRDNALSAYRKLVTGTANMAGLADVISFGIINQAPWGFQ